LKLRRYSTGDMLPAAYCREMGRLFGALPPIPFTEVASVVEFELDIDDLEDVFESFDQDPVAVGTIAQVHRAVLRGSAGPDGAAAAAEAGGAGSRVVAVKVPKPGVERVLLADIRAMRLASEACDALGLELGFDSASILREYERQAPLEFDLGREAAVMGAAGRSLQRGPPRAVLAEMHKTGAQWLGCCSIPRPVARHCTADLIVMEWADGQAMTEAAKWGDSTTLPPPAEGRRVVTALLQALGQGRTLLHF